ncbi:UPF0696 protein C11orf68 homolog isoform X2 [Ylistrum balloti]|uniref:UPF0696 protein C11orf68 homolog isoform X2 n=1 Tax=Ylistrum balloti TaxID=509963 RepID=UPI00290591CC|nr:UPF0696 protein C11orf68 homolog isoform X2 [Ylistrum balloti]
MFLRVTYEEIITSLERLSVDTEKIRGNFEERTDSYVIGVTKLPFMEWLQVNMPSRIRNEMNFISVFKPNRTSTNDAEDDEKEKDEKEEDEKEEDEEEEDEEEEEEYPVNVLALLKAFEQAVASKKVTEQLLFELADRFQITSGKWMLIPVTTGLKVDHLWTKVAWAIMEGSIPCHFAKVSTITDEGIDRNDGHVICIHNENFLDLDEVKALERGIRSIGLRGRLYYKPDVYTYCGIYSMNKWKIRPTIYKSDYDVKLKQSRIEKVTLGCPRTS